jgi:hypothetical protein
MNAAIGYVLIVLAILNLAGLLFLFRRFGAMPKTPNQQDPSPVADAPQPSPAASPEPAIPSEALSSMLRRLENRLGDIEDQVRRGPTVTMPNEPGGNTDRALALAQRLARQGASAKDIAETCGISLTEAELLHRLHASR